MQLQKKKPSGGSHVHESITVISRVCLFEVKLDNDETQKINGLQISKFKLI